jgi:hypothetical protein
LVREPSRTQGAYRELLLISGALFGLSIIFYAGLAFGYAAYLRSSLTEVDAQIQNFSAGISEEDRAQVQGFYSQLVNLRTLLAGHTTASPVLALLERTVQPGVHYTKLTLNANNRQVVLSGAADSLDDAAAQAAVLQGQPEVAHLDFNNAGAQAAGPWQFTLTVTLGPDVFRSVGADSGEAGAPVPDGPLEAPEIPTVPVAPAVTSTPTTSTPPATPTP